MNAEKPEEVPVEKEQNELEQVTLLTVTQVARMFQVTEYTVRTWLKTDGGLRGIKVGTGNTGRWRITKQELIRFANDRFGGDVVE